MKLLNNLIRIVVFIAWAMLIFYLMKLAGISFEPEDSATWRQYFRVIAVLIVFGGAYFIWKIRFFKNKER